MARQTAKKLGDNIGCSALLGAPQGEKKVGIVEFACAAPLARAFFALAIPSEVQSASGDPAQPAGSEEDLAKQLSNPVASLISVPLQFNYDRGIGPGHDGDKYFVNVQPVIPFSLTQDWNLISRTIVPIVNQNHIFSGAGSQTGLGDLLQSLFFSPAKPVGAE